MKATFHMGKIVNTHGIKGEIKIYPYTDDPYKFETFSYILISGEGDKKFKIASARVHKNMVLLKLKGYNLIEEVMPFMDKDIYIYRDDIEDADDGEGHYIVDLLGCTIVDQNGETIGILKDVLQNTAQDIYEVKHVSGKVFYIPVVDAYVKSINIDSKIIVVEMIEGLLE